MKTQRIVEILKSGIVDTDIVVKGWVRTKRGNKNVAFIALNDGRALRTYKWSSIFRNSAKKSSNPSLRVPASASTDGS